ncbi:MAG: DNA polymerase III subunit gamma/tau, partial [Pseudomonadota bacterium]
MTGDATAAPSQSTVATTSSPSPTGAPTPATTMRLVANAHAESAVPQPTGHVEPETEPEPKRISETTAPQPVEEPAVPLKSLRDIAALCDQHRDPLMKVNLRRCVRLVSIEPGRLSVSLTDDAPQALLGDLSRKLQDWTGVRWIVSLSRDEGGPTLEEEDNTKRAALLSDASKDPAVAKILDAFPGARIVDVRLAKGEGAAVATAVEDEMLPPDMPEEDDF